MRLIAVLLAISATGLSAQTPAENPGPSGTHDPNGSLLQRSPPPFGELRARPDPSAARLGGPRAPVTGQEPAREGPPSDPTLDTSDPSPRQAEEAPAAAATTVLDEGFWRQVLAGIIVTVISTLILRIIL